MDALLMEEYRYRNEKDQEYLAKIEDMLADMPEIVKTYERGIEGSTAPYTRLIYLHRIDVFFRFLYDSNPAICGDVTCDDLERLTADDIEEFAHYIRVRPGRNNSEASVNNYLSALSSFWSYLTSHGKVSHNVISDVKRGKKRKKAVTALGKAEKTAFFDAVQNGSGLTQRQKKYRTNAAACRDNAICTLLVQTGLRVSELAGIDLGDLDMQECCVRVLRKESKEDTVYFSDQTAETLSDYLQIRHELAPEGMNIYQKDSPLFLSSIGTHKGERLTVRAVQRLIRKYAAPSVPQKHITPHKLRSTYATDMIRKTGDLSLVQAELNHESPSTTALYIDSRKEELKEHRNDLDT